jgi:hypothetical protein
MSPRQPRALTLTMAGALLVIAGCGGGGEGNSGAAPTASSGTPSAASQGATTLGGTVAVGAPITNGLLRIVDADGKVVAANVPIDAQGRYAGITLSGPAPYRIEACGYAGANYLCVHSVAQGPGTANATPLTSATLLLASGQRPEDLMAGSATGLDSGKVAAAQTQLRAGLAPVLADAGVGSTLDFVTGALDAGSRTGHDRVLDAVGVTTGQDAKPFVQITPRLGQGNLYLEQGSTTGSVSVDRGAATVSLAGLETLFQRMSDAMASRSACLSSSTGIAATLASNARMRMDDDLAVQGVAAVAAGLCGFFEGNGSESPLWGARLMSPTLGRCDFSGPAPLCRVGFALHRPDGSVERVGANLGVTLEGGQWRFYGDADPIQLYASARVQRDVRIDGDSPVTRYSRALAFEVPALPGLACARVSQRDADGRAVTVALYKRHGASPRRLSLWTRDGNGNTPSSNPALGALRSADDTWVPLPDGAEGDGVVRNFFRGGRTVSFALFGDTACAIPLAIDGRSEFEVEVEGVPPVAAALEAMPWPALDAGTAAALRSLAMAPGASTRFEARWSFPRGPMGIQEATLCTARECGDGGSGRAGQARVRGGATAATIAATHGGAVAVAADGVKMLSLYGRDGQGLGVQSNHVSCPGVPANEVCR